MTQAASQQPDQTSKKLKIMFVCRAIDNMAGGVERMATSLMNQFAAEGHTISLLTWDRKGAKAFYPMAENITWYQLDMGNPAVKAGFGLRVKRALRVRECVAAAKPDVILAFQQGAFFSMRLYTTGMGIPVIAAERESPYRFDHLQAGKRRHLIFQTLRLTPYLTVQCESYRNAYPPYLRDRIVAIPNPVFPANGQAKPDIADKNGQYRLLCVGRLGYQKNQKVLVTAFAALAAQFPDWVLQLAGEGEDRSWLEDFIASHNLQGRIHMLGAVKDIPALLCDAHLFCLPARWEGFPNALAEALAHGLPSIGYEDCGGVRDLILNGQNGLLAAGNGDVETLQKALAALMSNNARRKVMGLNAVASVQPYQPTQIFAMWNDYLHRAASKR